MKIQHLLPVAAVVAALALSGCVTNTEGETQGGTERVSVEVDKAASDLVPADIRESGEAVIGVHTPYPPNEYRDENNNYAGWAVILTEAVVSKLGLKPVWQESSFETIIPNIQEGAMDMGSASFTDNKERQKVVDFVNYYEAGVLWVAPTGKPVDPNDACGHVIAVKQGSFQHLDELPKKSAECEAAGKKPIEMVPFDDQAQVTNAVRLGKAEAFSADSPVSLDAIAQSNDQLEPSGEAFDMTPYGFVVDKGSPMGEALQLALQSLIDDGTYTKILKDAGVEAGAVTKATINAGS